MKKFSKLETNQNRRKIFEANEQNGEEMVKANLPENIYQTAQQSTPAETSPKLLFSKLFESREMSHIYHLQVKDKGLASHLALNDYYESVLDLIDSLIETWQGQYNIIENYEIIDTKETNSKDKIEYFKELATFIKTERKCISLEDTHLHNIIDEIVALIYRTLYKLKYL